MIRRGKISNGLKSRKIYVWLISLGAVLAIYLLYSWLSKTPQIDISSGARLKGPIAGSDMDESRRGGTGMVGEVGVGTVKKAKYTHLNREKQVDREFGFEKLLHEVGDEWEIEKPYVNIFRRNFECYITADRGRVRVESVVGRASPKDATLIGNVVIHILPESGSSIKESFIYLDDVVFVSEKSQFSTAGPVKFVSQDAQMLGAGLELVYNDELDRLEFLRIIHLESLRLKSSKVTSSSSGETDVDTPASTGGQTKAQQLAEPVAAGVPQKAKAKPSPTAGRQAVEQSGGERYRCLFSKNVVIDTGEQLVFADEVSINNILWSKGSDRKSDKADVVPNFEDVSSVRSRSDIAGADNAEARNVTVSKPAEPGKSSKQRPDTVVTCDNGIVVTPMSSPRAFESYAKDLKEPNRFDDTGGRVTLVARKIDYCLDTDEVSLYGDCLYTVPQEERGVQRQYALSAPEIKVKLSRDKNKRSADSVFEIERFTAGGGAARLAILKTSKEEPRFAEGVHSGAPEQLLGGVELKCRKFDVDNRRGLFLATGPGLIKVDNSNIPESEVKGGRFSLRRRCYALLRNFDTLKYLLEANQVIADNKHDRILIDYFPIVKGRYGQQAAVTASHIEANLYETAGGRSELATLAATGGVTYEEEDIQFEGSQFFYNADSAIITAQGDELQPCIFNGAFVDSIEYDLETDRVKTKIAGPGILSRTD